MGLVVAVPVGPLGLLVHQSRVGDGADYRAVLRSWRRDRGCARRRHRRSRHYFDSGFLSEYQVLLRLIGGAFLCYLGYAIYRTEPVAQAAIRDINGLFGCLCDDFLSDIFQSGDDSFVRRHLCRLACAKLARSICRGGDVDPRRIHRLGALVGRLVHRPDGVSRKVQSAISLLGASGLRRDHRRVRRHRAF